MEPDPKSTALVVPENRPVAAVGGDQVVPAIIASAGTRASRRFLEFFAVTIENPNTRAAYFHACRRFFAWCDEKGLNELVAIEPMHVAAYVRSLGRNFEKPTVKQHLAAIRMLFDWLVVGQGRCYQSRACGARTEARRQTRQDASINAGRGAQADRQHRCHNASG
jgi:site-specific recombinase XerC